MAVITTTAIIASTLAALWGGSQGYSALTTSSARSKASSKQTTVQNKLKAGSQLNNVSTQNLEYAIRDAMFKGYIDGNTYKNSLAAFTKLRNNNYNYKSLSKSEAKSVSKLYSDLSKHDDVFRLQIAREFQNLTDDQKKAFLKGSGAGVGGVPMPTYLDTDFDNYQKEVEPVKYYTNKELADLYNIDYNFDNIKKDLDEAAEAAVIYSNWQSELAKNSAERDNIVNQTSYLDAIRNIKSQAVQEGMSTGARAAAELLANKEAVQNKALLENQTAQQRFETMNDSLLNRAQTQINTLGVYDKLAQTLSSNTGQLYANDINRYGQDLLSNANFLSADENLRSNRMAQNNLMRAYANAAAAQNSVLRAQANESSNYFNTISMPANDNDFTRALSSYLSLGYTQDTGYSDPMSKWGSAVNK